jgi:hypothetical protein
MAFGLDCVGVRLVRNVILAASARQHLYGLSRIYL